MPAAATRKNSPVSSPSAAPRPARTTRPAPARVPAPAPDEQGEWQRAAPLLEHFQEGTSHIEQARAERERLVRQRARRMHRPLRLRWPAALLSFWLVSLLVALLWLNGKAQSLARHDHALVVEIARVYDDNQRIQKKIASLDSHSRAEAMAKEMGWVPAEQSHFDDITKPTPWEPAKEKPPGEEEE